TPARIAQLLVFPTLLVFRDQGPECLALASAQLALGLEGIVGGLPEVGLGGGVGQIIATAALGDIGPPPRACAVALRIKPLATGAEDPELRVGRGDGDPHTRPGARRATELLIIIIDAAVRLTLRLNVARQLNHSGCASWPHGTSPPVWEGEHPSVGW